MTSPLFRVLIAYLLIVILCLSFWLREIVIFSIDGLILVTMAIVLPILSIFALLFDRGSDAWMNVPYAFTVLGCWWLIAVGFRRRAAPIGQAVILLGLVGWMIGYLFILGIGT